MLDIHESSVVRTLDNFGLSATACVARGTSDRGHMLFLGHSRLPGRIELDHLIEMDGSGQFEFVNSAREQFYTDSSS